MECKFLVSYSPSLKNYNLICIGGDKEKQHMKDIINAYDSDEVILEVTEEEYDKIRNDMEAKFLLYKINN